MEFFSEISGATGVFISTIAANDDSLAFSKGYKNYSTSLVSTSPPSGPPSNGWTVGDSNEIILINMENSSSRNPFDNTSSPQLPIDMTFNAGNRLAMTIYSLLMIISAVGNISVLSAIVRLRIKGRLGRINLFLLHLAIADLLVTFLMMPLEIAWNFTVSWQAGDMMCRVMSFFRVFGLYLSGFVLVCISLDRYFAVLKPLSIPEANSRGRIMLSVAWFASVLCSLPQSFIFHVEAHPDFPWYEQCITFNSFPTPEAELAYNFFGFSFLYGLPLIMIVFCYTRIIYEIYRINSLKRDEEEQLRRSNMGALGRAKIRTLKMTIIIVATFFFCWTPYNVMSLWYWFDKKSAIKVDPVIQKGLFLFACTNSCVNPLIYGLFHFRPTKRSSGLPPSQQNGYRPPLQSGSYKMRVRWKPNECCMLGCRSGGSSSDTTTPAIRENHNHIHIRPSQQYWVCNNKPTGHSCPTTSQEKAVPRDITIVNAHSSTVTSAPNGVGTGPSRGVQHCLNGHRRCSSLRMVDFERAVAPSTGGRATCRFDMVKRHFIDDKNYKSSCVSHVL